MEKGQRKWALLIVGAVVVMSLIPGVWLLRYNKRLLPVLGLKLELPQQVKNMPPVPFSVTVTQGKINAEATPDLSEDERTALIASLQMLFRVHPLNLAHYFKYFTTIGFGGGANLSAFVLVFSKEPPQISVDYGVKKVNWKGERITFDMSGFMVYSVDGVIEFSGQEDLSVRVFHSSSLGSGKVQPPADPRKIIPGEKF